MRHPSKVGLYKSRIAAKERRQTRARKISTARAAAAERIAKKGGAK